MKTKTMRHFTLLLLAFVCVSAKSQNLQTGIDQYKKENYDQAIKTLKALKSSSADYAEARFYLGRIAFDQEEYDDARGYFKEAYRKNDQVSKYYTWYGNATGTVAQSAGKIKQGMLAPKIKNAYKKAAELDPGDLDAQWGLMEFYSQAPGVMGGSWEKALAAADAVYKIDPEQGLDARATVFNRKEDFEAAEQEYIKLVELDEKYTNTLATFYQGREKFEQASVLFEKAFSLDPENWYALYQVGRTSALSGIFPEKGIQSLKQYMEEDRAENLPSHSAAKSRMAMIYEKQGDKSKAKSLYEEALKEDPEMDLAKQGLKRLKK